MRPQHTYLIAKEPRSGNTNCPAIYGTGAGDYIVVGETVTDHNALTAGVADNEAAVAVPRAVLAAVFHDELAGDDGGVVVMEVGPDSDIVIQEAGGEAGPSLVVDNGAVEWWVKLAGTTVHERLTVLDRLLCQLSELRVAESEQAEASAR